MGSMPPLLVAFVRDGSIFFALSAANTLLKIITTVEAHKMQQPAFFPWLQVVDSYAGAHLILRLRAAGMKSNVHQTWNETLSYRADNLNVGVNHSFQLSTLSPSGSRRRMGILGAM